MNILEYIRRILGNGKKDAKFYSEGLKKPFGDPTPLEVALYDGNQPLDNVDIGIEINKKQYIKKTDNDGIARLNINLPAGEYQADLYYPGSNEYNKVASYVKVYITAETYIDGINLTKNFGDPKPYQCAVYRKDTNERVAGEVELVINGRSYNRTPDEEGLYKLNINLNVGTYNIQANFKGTDEFNPSYINNTITINPKVEEPAPTYTSTNKKTIVLGCDSNTSDDADVQARIRERLEAEGYPVEILPIGPNFFATCDYSSNAKGKIGIYLIASGIFSIADAYYGSGQFDNYVFGIRGDFGDKGAVDFNRPIRADADCTSICNDLDGKTFNQMNAMLQPYVAICGGATSDELADNIINWLRAIEHKEERPAQQETNKYVKVLEYFEDQFGACEYIDIALEKIQGRGYSFYFSDGYNIYQTIDNIANGNGANCFDAAEVFYRLALGMNVKYGRNYKPEYLDVWCPTSGYDHIRLRFQIDGGYFYRDPACVLDGGEIEENWCGTSNNILEVNPSWIYEE